jgi:hypothetical protein
MVRLTNKTGFLLRDCWLWRGPRVVPLGDLDDGEAVEGTLSVSREDLTRGVAQARWERDLSLEMFKSREVGQLLKRAVVERAMQETLRNESGWPNQVTFIAWLDRPPVSVAVRPGSISVHHATMVRLHLPL